MTDTIDRFALGGLMLRTFMVRGIAIAAAAAFVAGASAGVRAAGQDAAQVEKGKTV